MGRASHFAIRSRVVVLAIAANCLLCAQPAVAALHDSIRHATKALQLDADGTSVSPHTDSADFSRGAGRVHSPTHEAGTPDLTTRFYHDFWRAIEETDSAAPPAVQRYHVWGNYIDQLLLQRDVAGGGNDYFAVGQHNYNVVALLDKSDVGNPIGHQGLYHDGETGLVYNRLRMLSPSLGRFMQRDPIGYPDGLNAYAAYHVMWGAVDPFGLESWWYQDLWWLVEYSVTSPNETAKMFGREVNSGYGDPVGAVQEISSALATSDHLASDFLTLADSALRRGVPQAVADGLNTGTDLWDSGVGLAEWTTGSDWSSCKAGQWSKDWLVDSSEYHREYAGNMVFEGAMGLLAANSLRSVSASARGAADEVAECADDAAVKLGKNANAPQSTLTQGQQRAVSKIDNALRDHMKPGDISGAVADQMGSPIPKPGGGYWNHAQEMQDTLRGLRKNAAALEGVTDPAAQAARQRALDAIKTVEEAIKGAGI